MTKLFLPPLCLKRSAGGFARVVLARNGANIGHWTGTAVRPNKSRREFCRFLSAVCDVLTGAFGVLSPRHIVSVGTRLSRHWGASRLHKLTVSVVTFFSNVLDDGKPRGMSAARPRAPQPFSKLPTCSSGKAALGPLRGSPHIMRIAGNANA